MRSSIPLRSSTALQTRNSRTCRACSSPSMGCVYIGQYRPLAYRTYQCVSQVVFEFTANAQIWPVRSRAYRSGIFGVTDSTIYPCIAIARSQHHNWRQHRQYLPHHRRRRLPLGLGFGLRQRPNIHGALLYRLRHGEPPRRRREHAVYAGYDQLRQAQCRSVTCEGALLEFSAWGDWRSTYGWGFRELYSSTFVSHVPDRHAASRDVVNDKLVR